MIEKYSLYYSYRDIGDILLVAFNQKTIPTSHERKGDVAIIYHDGEIIGYNIFNISKIVKIKTKGLIYFPSSVFIDVINSILENHHLENLAHFAHSGYAIGQIVNTSMSHGLCRSSIDIGGKILEGQLVPNLKVGDKVVVALPGATLYDGQEVEAISQTNSKTQSHICTNRELNIASNDDIYLVDEDGVVGEDFFRTGEDKYERN
ncbi:MAG TPA: DUF4479 domain-containing protein [Bacilli bacterium]|nr:DUF4479 domain-containing protein [Bacilli bacterium]HPS19101.1 DUF4479 domain-containing protein [Bacilli bacterium]